MYLPALPQVSGLSFDICSQLIVGAKAFSILLNPSSDIPSAFTYAAPASGGADVMRSAMGLFGSVMGVSSTKHPASCDLLILFVTGSVTWLELAALKVRTTWVLQV
jgi:hypothetical protein